MARELDDSPCDHLFDGGLCTQCLCPESAQHEQRAANAIENAQALMGTWLPEWHTFLTRDDALFRAWRAHRHRGDVQE